MFIEERHVRVLADADAQVGSVVGFERCSLRVAEPCTTVAQNVGKAARNIDRQRAKEVDPAGMCEVP